MKKTISFMAAIIMILTILSGCQKTPDDPIVIGKDIDNIIDKAGKNPAIATDGENLRELLNVPEKFTLETASTNDNLKIRADANVAVPNAASMPIARVTMGQFSEADVKKLYDALCGDAKPISPDALPMSAYYLQKAQYLREAKESGLLGDKMSQEDIDSEINGLMAQAASAPKSYERVEPDFSFKDNQDKTKWPLGLYTRLRFMPDDSVISEINVIQDPFGGSGAYAEYLRDNTLSGNFSPENQDVTLPNIKQNDAQKLAQDTITKLGLADFTCTGKRITPLDNDRGAYEFMFTRNINNVPITFTDDEGLITVHAAYFEPWMYEKIQILIDDEGVYYLKWSSPYTVKEIVSDASTMLPFSDIQAIFQRMTLIKYDDWSNDDFYSHEMNVTEVRLGLMRVTEKNVGDSGLIIPVWDFFGTVTLKGKPGKPNPSEGVDGSYIYTAFLTINAIDGSIIDRGLGY